MRMVDPLKTSMVSGFASRHLVRVIRQPQACAENRRGDLAFALASEASGQREHSKVQPRRTLAPLGGAAARNVAPLDNGP